MDATRVALAARTATRMAMRRVRSVSPTPSLATMPECAPTRLRHMETTTLSRHLQKELFQPSPAGRPQYSTWLYVSCLAMQCAAHLPCSQQNIRSVVQREITGSLTSARHSRRLRPTEAIKTIKGGNRSFSEQILVREAGDMLCGVAQFSQVVQEARRKFVIQAIAASSSFRRLPWRKNWPHSPRAIR